MGQTGDLSTVLERLAAAAVVALATDAAAVWLLDAAGNALSVTAAQGLPPDWPLAEGSAPTIASPQRVALIEGVAVGTPSVDGSSALCVALPDRGQPLGALCVYNFHPRQFSFAEIEILRRLADLGAAAIVTARKLDELEQIETNRGQFMRVTAHELRSPIAVAQSLLRNVLRGYAGPLTAVQRDVFVRVSGQLDFLGSLVNDFLDLTASRASTSVADERPVTLNESLGRVVLTLQPRAEEKNVTLLLRPPREELAVWATEDGLDHIFTNLVENAVKYTPAGGSVTVSAAPVGDQVRVTVSDTGIGIPAEALPHLFEEFYRAPNARAFKAVGTGLGLAIVKGLVERYHGRITVESLVEHGHNFHGDISPASESMTPVIPQSFHIGDNSYLGESACFHAPLSSIGTFPYIVISAVVAASGVSPDAERPVRAQGGYLGRARGYQPDGYQT